VDLLTGFHYIIAKCQQVPAAKQPGRSADHSLPPVFTLRMSGNTNIILLYSCMASREKNLPFICSSIHVNITNFIY